MKIGLVQFKARAGEIEANTEKICVYIEEAARLGGQIICFTEMSLCGYHFSQVMTDQWHREKLETKKAVAKIQELAVNLGIRVLVGGIDYGDDCQYIAQYVIGDQVETYHKIHIGQREGQYVTKGDDIKVFSCKDLTFGIMLCYDGHFPDLATIMADQGAQLIFNPSASPNDPAKRLSMWQKYLPARAYDNRVWVAGLNLPFEEKGGGMAVWNSDGDCLKTYTDQEDAMMIFDWYETIYNKTSMKQRDFKVDRCPDVYDKYR